MSDLPDFLAAYTGPVELGMGPLAHPFISVPADGDCPTVKRRYGSLAEAKQAWLDSLKAIKVGRAFKPPTNAYRCDQCDGWHLTTAPQHAWQL